MMLRMFMMQRLNGFSSMKWFSNIIAAGLWKPALPIVCFSPEQPHGQQCPTQAGTFHDSCNVAGSLFASILLLEDRSVLVNPWHTHQNICLFILLRNVPVVVIGRYLTENIRNCVEQGRTYLYVTEHTMQVSTCFVIE